MGTQHCCDINAWSLRVRHGGGQNLLLQLGQSAAADIMAWGGGTSDLAGTSHVHTPFYIWMRLYVAHGHGLLNCSSISSHRQMRHAGQRIMHNAGSIH